MSQIPPYPQQTQQQQQTMTGRPMDERITSLEVRVGGIEDGIKHIVAKLDSRERLPWGVLVGTAGFVVTLIGSIGGLAFTPLSAGISDVKATILKFEAKTENFMKREDIEAQISGLKKNVDDRLVVAADRRNDLQTRTDDRMTRIERDIDGLQKVVIPRGEHDERSAAQRVKDDGFQRQIDELRKDFSGIYTPRDNVQSMMRRLDDLETALRKR